jgi:hypothetical protein
MTEGGSTSSAEESVISWIALRLAQLRTPRKAGLSPAALTVPLATDVEEQRVWVTDYRLLKAADVPAFLQRAFIHSGYRYAYPVRQCMGSILQWHNESVRR